MSNLKLSQLQIDTLKFFGKNNFGKNFYWTGGTLLAYQYLNHRHSVDLDLFSDDLYSDQNYLIFINSLKKALAASRITFYQQQNRRLYTLKRKKESIKLELVYFPFPKIEPRKNIEKFALKIDSLADIMTNKTLAIYQRNEIKDIYDLYYYLNNNPKYNLFKLIKLVEKKFGIAIEPTLLLAKVNKLVDNLKSLQPLLIKKEENINKKIKSFFQKIFNSIAKKHIK